MKTPLSKLLFACTFVSLAGCSVAAQTQTSSCGFTESSYDLLGARTGSGCPFSAEIEMDRTETLSDGTQIRTKSKSLIYRDSAGRIRRDSYAATPMNKEASSTPFSTEIYDPVAGIEYERRPMSGPARRYPIEEATTEPIVAARPPHPTTSAPSSASADKPASRARIDAVSHDEELEPQQIEGLLATGRRSTRTVPAGSAGNDRPITITSEVWSSAELGVTLVSKSSDPRIGEMVSRMFHIDRSEPDPALFQIPADDKTE
jgi:hypothetical protein